jgi:SAM-dependent methyltransferase
MSAVNLLDDYLYIAHTIDRRMAEAYCPMLQGDVLDIGCGTRPYRRFLTNARCYVGIDQNPDVRPDVVGSVLDLPFGDASFDGVLCTEVLEHVPDPFVAARELFRVTRPGGKVYVTVPQAWGLHYEPNDYFRYTKYGIMHVLEGVGFSVCEVRQMGGLFSYFSVRLIDLLVLDVLFRLLDRLGIQRGRYRLAALLVFPLNATFGRLSIALDRLDRYNAYGWAVVASKDGYPPQSEEEGASEASE